MTIAIDMRDPNAAEYVKLATLKAGVRLESKGMKLSKGPSATARAKAVLGLGRGAKRETVLEQLEARMAVILQEREKDQLEA